MSQVLAQTTNAITTNAIITIMIQMEREDLGLLGSSDIATQWEPNVSSPSSGQKTILLTVAAKQQPCGVQVVEWSGLASN